MKAGAFGLIKTNLAGIDLPQIHLALSPLPYDLSLTVYRAGFIGGAKFAG